MQYPLQLWGLCEIGDENGLRSNSGLSPFLARNVATLPNGCCALQVKLFTVEGHLKYETECNPRNGYFMIPVYHKGQYQIRVAALEGWFFGT